MVEYTKEQLQALAIAEAKAKLKQKQTASEPEPQNFGDQFGAFVQLLAKGGSFGFADDVGAELAAIALKGGAEINEAFGGRNAPSYGQFRDLAHRNKNRGVAQFEEEHPYIAMGAEFVGALSSGSAAAKAFAAKYPRQAQWLVNMAKNKPVRTSTTAAAGSGALYGYGAGEGGVDDRAINALHTGAWSAPFGVVGHIGARGFHKLGQAVDNMPITDSVRGFLKQFKPRDIPDVEGDDLQNIILDAAEGRAPQGFDPSQMNTKAFKKIEKAIRKDFPDNADEVLTAWKQGKVALADLNSPRVTRLLKGSAQYSEGDARAVKYFEERIPQARDDMEKAINNNISDVTLYHASVDDVYKVGREKARPLYDEAYEGSVEFIAPFADNVTIKPTTQVKRGDEYLDAVDIYQDGQKKGQILYKQDGKTVTIKRADVEDSGKGIGSQAYKIFIDDKLDNGFVIHSDADVSTPAQGVYRKLKGAGYDVVEADDVYTGVGGKKTTVPRSERLKQMSEMPTEYDATTGVRSTKAGYANLKGAPVYTISGKTSTLPQELQSAIASARQKYPSELEGFADNSVKVLDYAKKELDDEIGEAYRQGRTNYANSRRKIRDDLIAKIDDQVPKYKEARKEAGDYLKIVDAMERGRNFERDDIEIVMKYINDLEPNELNAYRIGVGKQLRDKLNKAYEGSNAFNRLMGSKTQKQKLRQILGDTQYFKLEKQMRAQDAIYKIRNEVLGGSRTASNQQAAREVGLGIADTLDVASGGLQAVPRKTTTMFLTKMFDGLNNRLAGEVADILYETDPVKKLAIIKGLDKKLLTKAEKQKVKEIAFRAEEELFKYFWGSGSSGTLVGSEITNYRENEAQ